MFQEMKPISVCSEAWSIRRRENSGLAAWPPTVLQEGTASGKQPEAQKEGREPGWGRRQEVKTRARVLLGSLVE